MCRQSGPRTFYGSRERMLRNPALLSHALLSSKRFRQTPGSSDGQPVKRLLPRFQASRHAATALTFSDPADEHYDAGLLPPELEAYPTLHQQVANCPETKWLGGGEGGIPKGQLTLLLAFPGVGKTTFCYNLAVAVSRGSGMRLRLFKCKPMQRGVAGQL